jgi:hypothetical protein
MARALVGFPSLGAIHPLSEFPADRWGIAGI